MLAVAMSQPMAHFGPVHKRPKLSLQTSALPITYGCSSQGLSVTAQSTSTVTPTTLNTFNNAYDLSYRPSPTSAVESIRSVRPSRSQSPRPSRRSERPYNINLPYGVKPILKNSALRNNSISASPCTSTRKVFFPQPKRVGFTKELEEDIVTKVYTARHSDLLVKSEDEDVAQSIEDDTVPIIYQDEAETFSSLKKRKFEIQPDNTIQISATEVKISSSASNATTTLSSFDSSDADTTVRRKRRWEWTLAPVAQEQDEQQSECTGLSGAEGEDDSDWVIVSISKSDLEQWQSDLEPPSRKRRATSLDTENDTIAEPARKLTRAASW